MAKNPVDMTWRELTELASKNPTEPEHYWGKAEMERRRSLIMLWSTVFAAASAFASAIAAAAAWYLIFTASE